VSPVTSAPVLLLSCLWLKLLLVLLRSDSSSMMPLSRGRPLGEGRPLIIMPPPLLATSSDS
jgi:hypothetical protein